MTLEVRRPFSCGLKTPLDLIKGSRLHVNHSRMTLVSQAACREKDGSSVPEGGAVGIRNSEEQQLCETFVQQARIPAFRRSPAFES